MSDRRAQVVAAEGGREHESERTSSVRERARTAANAAMPPHQRAGDGHGG